MGNKMSGGSMNYIYSRIEVDVSFEKNTPERKAFDEHLKLIINALHDIEWVDSGDYAKGDETAAIRACIVNETLRQDAKRYQYIRKLNVPQFALLFRMNIEGGGHFDDLIDAAIAKEKAE